MRLRRQTGFGLALLLVVPLAACDPGIEGSPRAVAQQVAGALETGSFEDVPLVDGTTEAATQRREVVYAGLGDVPLVVDVIDVVEDTETNRAEATLRLTWDLPGEGEDFSQEVPLLMRISQDEWVASWDHGLLGVPRGQVLQVQEVAARRADIVDREGAPLATARPVWRIGIDKTLVPAAEVEDAARALAGAGEFDEDEFAARVDSAGDEAFVELITYRQSDEAGVELVDAVGRIEGAVALEDEQVLGPSRTFAQPLLGSVGQVTQEMIEERPDELEPGDVVGLTGVQAAFDEQLQGAPGIAVLAVDEDSSSSTTLLERDPVTPDPVRLTLRTDLQRLAEQALDEVEPPSSLVAIDHTTGDVVAMANGPGSEGASTALSGQYAPGSTFKLASALVLLRNGFTPWTTVRCEETLTVDGFSFRNVTGYPESALGDIMLETAMANSCNTALINEMDDIPMDELATAAADLGIGGVWEMPVTAFSGSAPEEAANDTEHAASILGQGNVLASPTAMAVVAASIAAGGPVVPRVVADQAVPTADGSLTSQEADRLRLMMRAVVTDGSAQLLLDNPGPEVLAKTGTAEFGSEDPPLTHVWIVAIQGDLAVSVFIEEGEFGSTTAGPVMDEFLTAVGEG